MNDWDDVRFFLEVARSGNVTGAARQLGVNHSTVSRRIRSLEDKYGVRLFERIASGYELTGDGAEVLELAQQLEQQHLAMARRLHGQDQRLHGRVTVTMPNDLAYFLSSELAGFQQQHPGITLDIVVAKGLSNLAAREADIAVRVTPAPPDYLVGKQVAELAYGLFQAEDFAAGDSTPIIAWRMDNKLPDWALKYCRNPVVVQRVDDLISMYLAVEAGLGMARMPVFIHNILHSDSVIQLPQALPKSGWGLWVLSHADLRRTARVQACRQYLLEVLEKQAALFG